MFWSQTPQDLSGSDEFLYGLRISIRGYLKKVNVHQEELKSLAQGGSVLGQAFADKDNPLAWAVLAHEYGHALNDSKLISQEIVFGKAPAKKRQRTKASKRRQLEWAAAVVAETVADFVAARVLGPASLMPILFVEMLTLRLKKIERISSNHPPTPLRVRLVCDYLKSLNVSTADFDPVFKVYAFDYERKLQAMDKSDREWVNTTANTADKLLSSLAEKIASKVNSLGLVRFTERNAKAARLLQETLAQRLPISSRRRLPEKKIFTMLNSLREDATPEEAYGILSELDERPVASSEILTAGWLHRLSSLEGELMKTFSEGGTGRKADLGSYSRYVEKTDGLLLKSLELAAVHADVLSRLRRGYAAF